MDGDLPLEVVCEQEGSLLQIVKVQVLDQFEVTVKLSDGELVISAIADRKVYGLDVIKNNLLKEFNIVNIKKTLGQLVTKDLKIIQFKTPREEQMTKPEKVGNPIHFKQEKLQGRFSSEGNLYFFVVVLYCTVVYSV